MIIPSAALELSLLIPTKECHACAFVFLFLVRKLPMRTTQRLAFRCGLRGKVRVRVRVQTRTEWVLVSSLPCQALSSEAVALRAQCPINRAHPRFFCTMCGAHLAQVAPKRVRTSARLRSLAHAVLLTLSLAPTVVTPASYRRIRALKSYYYSSTPGIVVLRVSSACGTGHA